MDGSHCPSNGISTTSSGQTYPSPTAISPNQLRTGSPLLWALPLLQPPTSAIQNVCGSHPSTPRTSRTPNTPESASNMPSYQQQTSQPVKHAGIYSIAQSQYPPPQTYGTSAAKTQATTAASHPHPTAPTPARVSSPHGPGSLMQPTEVMPEGDQGRRRRSRRAIVLQRDADGKFLCPECKEPFIERHHLWRHHGRHTGDRPYMCVLCRDTFSRSDILKRHFQKCSIRRGNPSEASHLSYPQAQMKKNQRQAQNAASLCHEVDLNHPQWLELPVHKQHGPAIWHNFSVGRLEQHGPGSEPALPTQLDVNPSSSQRYLPPPGYSRFWR
ncbi:hypothetical protein FOMA001_g19849 [Fusarium oxysporum f. sp. matthiolae]|nr:hypothetical protein FOMA001_g19849 [Fusarium oxysporum f. sp. matthiolae]